MLFSNIFKIKVELNQFTLPKYIYKNIITIVQFTKSDIIFNDYIDS